MPLNDNYGQGVPYPTLTDVPNIQTAAEAIVNGLVPRGVMRFPSASNRGATITGPEAGMLSWLEDQRLLQIYDGTGWSTISGGTSVWRDIQLTNGYSNGGNSLGNLQYRVVNLFGEVGLALRGGVEPHYVGNSAVNSTLNAFALPVEARPPSGVRITVSIPCSDQNSARVSLKMDLNDSGFLSVVGFQSDTKPVWVGFDGVAFSLKRPTL